MKSNKLFRRAAAFAAAACMTLAGVSQVALADYAVSGDVLDGWVCQVVVKNGVNDEHSYLWMNDGACESISYKTEQHVVLDPADGAFANAEDVLEFAAIYFRYYGEYTGDAEFDVRLTNVTIYSTGYDPIVLADYSSVDAGTNNPDGNDYAVSYDFQDQLDVSVRTDVLRNLDRIEFDLYVEGANFSDAPQVDPSDEPAEPQDEYTELASVGQASELDIMFFAMDTNWKWTEPGTTQKIKYQTDEHMVLEIDGTKFAEAVGPMNSAGFQVGYYTDQLPDDTKYSVKYTLSNVVMNFDGYDSIACGDFSSETAEWETAGNAGKNFIDLTLFPAGTDTAEMFRHLTSIEFDYHVEYIGATGVEAPAESSEEPTEDTSGETAEEETTTEEEKTTEEPTEEQTSSEEASSEESTEESAAPAAAEPDDGSGSNTVKIIVTVVSVVILLGALVAVGVMYVKKSKQI